MWKSNCNYCWPLIILAINLFLVISVGCSSSPHFGLVNYQQFSTFSSSSSSILLSEIVKEWGLENKAISDIIVRFLHDLVVAIKSSSFPTAVAQNISQQCTDDSLLYVHSLYTSLWALQSTSNFFLHYFE